MTRRNPWPPLGVGLIKLLLGCGLLITAVTAARATAALPARAILTARAIAQANPRLPAPSLPLQPGQTGDKVKQLQAILAQLGWYKATLDGLYGPTTTEAVQAFQTYQGLPVDGIVGPQTWQRLTLYGASQMFSQMPQLQPDTLAFTLLTVTPPVPPPSPFWLLLMPIIPLIGGGLTYLHHQRQARR